MIIIDKYFHSLGEKQKDLFAGLGKLYDSWNEKINVISRKDIANLYLHHVLHSLAIAKVISFGPGTVIIDAGTGGGFPGIPLAIMFPEARFTLVDSVSKKLIVVGDIIEKLNLVNCRIVNGRMEELSLSCDFIVSRAVSSMPELSRWGRKMVTPGGRNSLPNGMLILKGGDLGKELKDFGNKATVYDIEDFFVEEYFRNKKLIYLPAG
jgi:16S rRNA (guanine527-N7)-methyltransferase